MNTITIISDKKDSIKQIHFNLWNSKKNNLHFLDIGILCENDFSTIMINLPRGDSSKVLETEDLSEKMVNNIPNAIFNEAIDIEERDKLKIFKFKSAEKEPFIVFPFDSINCINKDNYDIKITVQKTNYKLNSEEIKNKYYRFRIKNFDHSTVIIEIASKSKSFESSFSSCKIVDFRLNDLKLLKNSIVQKIVTNSYPFLKVHFLYIADIDEDIQLASDNYSARFLEREVWDDYLNLKQDKIKTDMIAYHLREKETFSTSFLLKCRYNNTSFKHLSIYATIVIGLAFVANVFTKGLFYLFSMLNLVFKK